MSFGKRLWHGLTAFFYLRLYELLFAFIVLAAVFYFTKSIAVPPQLQSEPRPIYAFQSALGVAGIYYFLFGYFFAALFAVLILRITPFFNRATLAAVNALVYAAHGLWLLLSFRQSLALSLWLAWLIIVAFNALSPSLLPRRLFDS